MDNANIAAKEPVKVNLEADQYYFFCTCGRSQSQPFCDGAHKGTSFAPHPFIVESDQDAFLCQCKQTNNPPYCDGSHKHCADS